MSVINQMLRDLDARQASEQERAGLPPRLRTLPALAATRKQSWRMLVLGMGIGALVAGIGAGVVLAPAPITEPAPAPVASPPPPTIAPTEPVAVPPAPTLSPSQTEMSADTSEMKLSTLLARARSLPAESPPAVAPPVKAKAVPVPDKAVAEPVKAAPVTPAAKPPAAPVQQATSPAQKAERTGVPPSGEVQIDKRSKGGAGREMAETEYRKGMQAVRRGDNAAAQPLLQHALELDPSLPKARQALLSVLVSGKRWQDAQQVAQDGLALDPKQSGWAIILARLQFEQGDVAAALETLERHAPYAGGDADYQSLFAYLLQRQQRFPEAAERFRAALSLRPNEGRWWFGLGIALDAGGKGTEAKDAFSKARDTGNLPADMAAIVEQKLK